MGKAFRLSCIVYAIPISLLVAGIVVVSSSEFALAAPTLELSPQAGPAGTNVKASGSGYAASSGVTITFDGGYVNTRPEVVVTNSAGSFEATFWVPFSIDMGSYSVVARDYSGLKNSASASFQVIAPNNRPLAESMSIDTAGNDQLTISLKGSDADGDVITFIIVDQPQHGVIDAFDPTSGSLTYIPDSGYNGEDSFTFKVNDGHVDSAVAKVSLGSAESGVGPSMQNMVVEVEEDAEVVVFLTASDLDSSSLTFGIVSSPQHGVLGEITPYDSKSAFVTYSAVSNFNGADSFTAKASDGRYESQIATITVDVTPLQDAPVANDAQTTTTQGLSFLMTLTASDPDGDPLTYILESSPTHGNLAGTAPNLTYAPLDDFSGLDGFTFKVNDGTADSNTARVVITVEQLASSASGGNANGDNSNTIPDGINPTPALQVPASSSVENVPIASQLGDTIPPRLIFPASMLVFDSQSQTGATVSYNIAAIDDKDGEITPDCSPASGSRFPIGTVNVICKASDSSQNSAFGSFVVDVRLVANNEKRADFFQFDLPDFPVIASLVGAVVAIAGVTSYLVLRAVKKTKTTRSEHKSPA